jgi:hypothetical protein
VVKKGATVAEIIVDVKKDILTNDKGDAVEGIVVTCPECGFQVECFGTGLPSVKRACATLREDCPEGLENWYTTDELKAEQTQTRPRRRWTR